MVAVVDHETVHTVVDPTTLEIAGDHHMPSPKVAPPIAIVDVGRGKLKKVCLRAQKNIFLTAPRGDLAWRDAFFLSLKIKLDNLFQRGIHREPQAQGEAAIAVFSAHGDWRPENAPARIIFDFLKQDSRALSLADPSSDRPGLEIPVHLAGDPPQFAMFFQLCHPGAQIVISHKPFTFFLSGHTISLRHRSARSPRSAL